MSGPIFGPPSIQIGAIVLTDRAIFFAEWERSAHAYVVVKRILFTEIMEVSVFRWGVSRTLVIQQNNFAFDTFGFTRGILNDAEKADEAAAVLRAAIATQR